MMRSTAVLLAGLLGAASGVAAEIAPLQGPVAALEFSFKMDPRLTRGLYKGDQWLSVSNFVGARGQEVVETRVTVRDDRGRALAVAPRWMPSDPKMVAVEPMQGSEVRIRVQQPGESRVTVSAGGRTEELVIRAAQKNDRLSLEIHRRS